jgi:hypothetical protein
MTAAGGPIVADGRCAALTMSDIDNDGRKDLLVGQSTNGRLRIYHNLGTASRPEFCEARDLIAGDEPACVPSGCYTAFSPQLIDFDGDGRSDILSPSFSSGIFLFRRAEDGTFAEPEMLDDRHGQPIEFRYNGAALACDWDDDGDLDLVVGGSLAGARNGVNVIVNEGDDRNPVYGNLQLLTADGRRVLGKPCAVADWDGDGRNDLLTCAGSAYWYRNTGDKGKPVLQSPEFLAPSGRYHQINHRPNTPQRVPDEPGRLDSICVADVNGDGRLDLLAASTWCENVELPEPTDQQRTAETEIEAQVRSLSRKYRDLSTSPQNESREERRQRLRELLLAWRKYAAVRVAGSELQSRHEYSCVWLFERTAVRD